MMITTQALYIEKSLIERIDSVLSNYIDEGTSLLLTGKSYSKDVANRYLKTTFFHSYSITDNSLSELNDLTNDILDMNINYIVALGGGSVIDFAKRMALFRNVKLYVIPTIVSNDGLFSPIAVLRDPKGKSVSLKGHQPDGVFIDIDLVHNAPSKFIYSAIADLLSNISATRDWIYSEELTGKRVNSVALTLSRQSAMLIVDTLEDFNSVEILERVVFAQLMSGSAMSIAGSSRPCSGAEHLISHAIDFHGFQRIDILHGEQVGSISLYILYLHKELTDKIIRIAESLSLSLDWTEMLSNTDDSTLIQIFETALSVRPGRITILNSFNSADEFIESLNEFKMEMKKKLN